MGRCISEGEVLRGLRKLFVNDERIGVVEEYKYLGCMVNDQLNCSRMVEETAKAGAKALSCVLKCGVVAGSWFP